MFKDHFLKNVITSEAAVERACSRHKDVHSTFRTNLSPEIVDQMLFVRYNIILVYPALLTMENEDNEGNEETEPLFF